MINSLTINLKSRETIQTIIFNASAFLFIFLVPAISHLIMLPVYYIEPMRLMLILMLLHTSRSNAYIIALTLPAFSFLLSGHPVPPKMMLITAELALNVFLFYFLVNKIKSVPAAMITSVIGSKIFYYLIKIVLINAAILSTGLVGIPIYMQIIMLLLFTGYAFAVMKKKTMNNE
ncbi:MAG: hypothetical protein K9J21_10045 [Bacteroidales bacterium]|nr:hypothetical protein [Bacteroidales bacterium]